MTIAKLDVGDLQGARNLFEELIKKFGRNSNRLRVLQGMMLEANGQYDKAMQFYERLIQDNPLDQNFVKRAICVHKALGNKGEAILLLSNYLKNNSADFNGWLELADLYLSENEFLFRLFFLFLFFIHFFDQSCKSRILLRGNDFTFT